MTASRGPANERGPRPGEGKRRASASANKYMGLGLQFGGAIVLFLFAGQWLDRKLGTAPWLLIAGVFVGASAGFYSMYKRVMNDLEREKQAKQQGASKPASGPPSTGAGPRPGSDS